MENVKERILWKLSFRKKRAMFKGSSFKKQKSPSDYLLSSFFLEGGGGLIKFYKITKPTNSWLAFFSLYLICIVERRNTRLATPISLGGAWSRSKTSRVADRTTICPITALVACWNKIIMMNSSLFERNWKN